MSATVTIAVIAIIVVAVLAWGSCIVFTGVSVILMANRYLDLG